MQFNLYFKRTSLLSATYSLLLAFFFSSCEKEPTKKNQLPDAKTQKVWILNEGLFNFGNTSLDVYVPDSQQIFNDVYKTANAKSLGDVGQSISFNGSFAYVVVNNSGKIVVLDKKNISRSRGYKHSKQFTAILTFCKRRFSLCNRVVCKANLAHQSGHQNFARYYFHHRLDRADCSQWQRIVYCTTHQAQ